MFIFCPECGKELQPTLNIRDEPSKWFSECVDRNCPTVVNTKFHPLKHQLMAMHSTAKYIGLFGGYGSAKTSTAGMIIFSHMLEVPNAKVLLMAPTIKQAMETCVLELQEIIPKKLIFKHKQSQDGWEMTLTNGSTAMLLSSNDALKLRSLNLTACWIEESTAVNYSIYKQIQSRLRKDSANVYERDKNGQIVYDQVDDGFGGFNPVAKILYTKFKLVLSSNPGAGWVVDAFIEKCKPSNVFYFGDDAGTREITLERAHGKRENLETYIIATNRNIYLPPEFIPDLMKEYTEAEVKQLIHGSFDFSDGAVYPTASQRIIDDFPIPMEWAAFIAIDFGRRDSTAMVLGVVNPKTKIVYICDFYESLPEDEDKDWFDSLRRLKDVAGPRLRYKVIGDPAGQSKGQAMPMSWFEYYRNEGFDLIPARSGRGTGINNIAAISVVNKAFESGKLFIFRSLVEFIKKIKRYKYKKDKSGFYSSIPQEHNDHLPDALKYLITTIPKSYGDTAEFSGDTYNPRLNRWKTVTLTGHRIPRDDVFKKGTSYKTELLGIKKKHKGPIDSWFDEGF